MSSPKHKSSPLFTRRDVWRIIIIESGAIGGGMIASGAWASIVSDPFWQHTGALILIMVFVVCGTWVALHLWSRSEIQRPKALLSPGPRSETSVSPGEPDGVRPIERQFVRKSIKLSELASDECLLRDYTFVECEIHGPAVLCGAGGSITIYSPSYTCRSPDSTFVEMDNRPERPDGMIGVRDCQFHNCRLFHITWAFPKPLVDDAKREMQVMPSQEVVEEAKGGQEIVVEAERSQEG